MAHVYSLTHLTGRRRNDVRRTVVLTVEVNRHTFLVVLLSLAASVLPTLLAVVLFGIWGVLVPPLTVCAGILLWDTRQRRGMRLQNWQAIVNRRRSQSGTLFVSGRPVPKPTLVMHQRVVIPAYPTTTAPEPIRPETHTRRHSRLSVKGMAE